MASVFLYTPDKFSFHHLACLKNSQFLQEIWTHMYLYNRGHPSIKHIIANYLQWTFLLQHNVRLGLYKNWYLFYLSSCNHGRPTHYFRTKYACMDKKPLSILPSAGQHTSQLTQTLHKALHKKWLKKGNCLFQIQKKYNPSINSVVFN